MAGDIFQIVPSRQFREKITQPPFYFYRRLRQVNPSPYMFYLNFGSTKFVGASPEMLVKVMGDKLYTYPIAGTRRRGKDDFSVHTRREAQVIGALYEAKNSLQQVVAIRATTNDMQE